MYIKHAQENKVGIDVCIIDLNLHYSIRRGNFVLLRLIDSHNAADLAAYASGGLFGRAPPLTTDATNDLLRPPHDSPSVSPSKSKSPLFAQRHLPPYAHSPKSDVSRLLRETMDGMSVLGASANVIGVGNEAIDRSVAGDPSCSVDGEDNISGEGSTLGSVNGPCKGMMETTEDPEGAPITVKISFVRDGSNMSAHVEADEINSGSVCGDKFILVCREDVQGEGLIDPIPFEQPFPLEAVDASFDDREIHLDLSNINDAVNLNDSEDSDECERSDTDVSQIFEEEGSEEASFDEEENTRETNDLMFDFEESVGAAEAILTEDFEIINSDVTMTGVSDDKFVSATQQLTTVSVSNTPKVGRLQLPALPTTSLKSTRRTSMKSAATDIHRAQSPKGSLGGPDWVAMEILEPGEVLLDWHSCEEVRPPIDQRLILFIKC
jgi:hypothetical protein